MRCLPDPAAAPSAEARRGPQVVRLSCTFDTMDATEPVKAGWGTQNEMCLAVVYATLGL